MKNQTKSAAAPTTTKREPNAKARKQRPAKAATKAAKLIDPKDIAATRTRRVGP